MADRYLRSTDGNNADDGSSWDLAKATLVGIGAIDTTGDLIRTSQANASVESTGGAVTVLLAGTLAYPTKLVCVDDSTGALANTASVTTTGASSLTLSGVGLYCYGHNFSVGSAANQASFTYADDGACAVFESCSFTLNNSAAASAIYLGSGVANNNTKITLKDSWFKFGATGQKINLVNCNAEIIGGGLLSGGSTPTTLFTSYSSNAVALVSGMDLSNAAAGLIIVSGSVACLGRFIFRNIKLPASWSGRLVDTAPAVPGFRAELHNYSVGTTEYQLWTEDYAGTIKSETTVVRSSGATDGITPYSWKLTASANAKYPLLPLVTPEISPIWNENTGTAVTVAVEILSDSVTALNEEDVWLEVQYLGASGSLLSSFVHDGPADFFDTNAFGNADAQDSSAASWTTTGLTNPNKQKLSVTFTPQNAGFIQAKVFLAKPSSTVYVDPKLTVS